MRKLFFSCMYIFLCMLNYKKCVYFKKNEVKNKDLPHLWCLPWFYLTYIWQCVFQLRFTKYIIVCFAIVKQTPLMCMGMFRIPLYEGSVFKASCVYLLGTPRVTSLSLSYIRSFRRKPNSYEWCLLWHIFCILALLGD